MQLTDERIGAWTLITIRGRLDSATAAALDEAVRQALDERAPGLLLDLERLEYISSAGFRSLLVAARQAEARGGALHLCGLSAKVGELFELGGFTDLFPTYPDRRGALDALRPAG